MHRTDACKLVITVSVGGEVVGKIALEIHPPGFTLVSMNAPAASSGGPQTARDPIPLRIDPSGPRLSALLDEYEAAKRVTGVTEGHIDDCVGGVRRAAHEMGWIWHSQMTDAEFVRWLERCKARGNGPKTRNDARHHLLAFSAWLEARGLGSAVNPKAVPRARVPKRRTRYCPTRDEVVALIVASSLDWRKRDRWLVYLVAGTTGLRMRTLRNLRWEHISEMDGRACLDLPASIVKNRSDTRVWITRECCERLRRHRESGEAATASCSPACPSSTASTATWRPRAWPRSTRPEGSRSHRTRCGTSRRCIWPRPMRSGSPSGSGRWGTRPMR